MHGVLWRQLGRDGAARDPVEQRFAEVIVSIRYPASERNADKEAAERPNVDRLVIPAKAGSDRANRGAGRRNGIWDG